MKMYEYLLIEKTVISVVVEANDKDEANDKVESILEGDVDWGMGGMEITYEFNGEVK
jgi:hypothetical protein